MSVFQKISRCDTPRPRFKGRGSGQKGEGKERENGEKGKEEGEGAWTQIRPPTNLKVALLSRSSDVIALHLEK